MGDALRKSRTDLGLSLFQVGIKIGVTPTAIRQAEDGFASEELLEHIRRELEKAARRVA